jgi:2-(1,2-epoxy-1,2-dihydrophenyl)acetyl-CoA isomerase
MRLAAQLAKMPTRGLWLTKRLLNESMTNNLETQLRLEGSLQTEAGGTEDHREGVKAFLEKRTPVFTGK